jgi:RNA-binding protein
MGVPFHPRDVIETPETMKHLTSKQRAHLRSLAHSLKPILHVGKEGVTDTLVQGVRDAFNGRELLKVKVLDTAPAGPRETSEQLAVRGEDVHVVQVIGRTIVLYKPDPDEPAIRLPF